MVARTAISKPKNITSSFMFTLSIFAERNYVGPYPPVNYIVTKIVDTENNLFFGRLITKLPYSIIKQYLEEIGVNYVVAIKNTAYDYVFGRYLEEKYENNLFKIYVFNETNDVRIDFRDPKIIYVTLNSLKKSIALKAIYYRSWKADKAKVKYYLTKTTPQLPFIYINKVKDRKITLRYEMPLNVEIGIYITYLTIILEILLIINLIKIYFSL